MRCRSVVGRIRLTSALDAADAACSQRSCINFYSWFFVKMEDNFDVDKFASLIKTKESIWNYKSTAYANKTQRRADWTSVCEGMIPDFGEKTNEEKSAIVLQMQTKWRVLRDGFTRSVKNYNEKLESGSKGKLYVYYEQLHFLHDLYEAKVLTAQSNSSTCSRHKTERSRKRHKNNAGESSEDLDDEKVCQKRAPEKAKASVNSVDNYDECRMEEDKQFLLSLLSDFKKIPEDQKLDAKGDIINVIRHYRNPTLQFDTRGSYYTSDITALATTATDGYYEHALIDTRSRDSSSPIEIKFTN